MVTIPEPLILTALSRVGLLDLINSHGGLETEAVDLPLSHGQKQLLCLVRAMLSHSSILIMDEATSSVDAVTEDLVQDIPRTESQGRTVLAVAHRLGTIVDFDRVLVLDQGRVVEFGEPRDLLTREDGYFRMLHERRQ